MGGELEVCSNYMVMVPRIPDYSTGSGRQANQKYCGDFVAHTPGPNRLSISQIGFLISESTKPWTQLDLTWHWHQTMAMV